MTARSRSNSERLWARVRRGLWAVPVALACVVASQAAPAEASARERSAAWAALTPAQQNVLQPLQGEWGRIDPDRRSKWVAIADRFPTLPGSEQARVQARMVEWARLSPAERGQARQNFKEAQRAEPQDRKARWEAYNALSPEQRRELAARGSSPSAPKSAAGKANSAATSTKASLETARRAKPVTPTLSQAQSGATTRLMSRNPTPPAHQQSGQPKIAATPGLVDKTTLLPKQGPQGAAVRSEPAPRSGGNP